MSVPSPIDFNTTGFVVRDRHENDIQGYTVVNETELATLVQMVQDKGFLLFVGEINDGIITGELKPFRNGSVHLSPPTPHIPEAATPKAANPTGSNAGKSPEVIISELFQQLVASSNGLLQSEVERYMAGVITTTPAFSLRMKPYAKLRGYELTRDGKPPVYKLTKV